MKINTQRLAVECAAALLPIAAHAATFTVACPGQSIQSAVDQAQPGDIINVTGTCTENVVVRNEKSRFVIDGGNVATVQGGSTLPAFLIRGKGIQVNNFSIVGGLSGITVSRAANALFKHNDIRGAAANGIHVREMSYAALTGNTIHNNGGNGILVQEHSAANIGFNEIDSPVVDGNTVTNNTLSGISVVHHSTAWIVGNNTSSNGLYGVHVGRVSQANIADNTINANGESGILVDGVSVAQLGEDSGTNAVAAFDAPNATTSANVKYGVVCAGGSFYGHLGGTNQLTGALGQSFPVGCGSSLITP